MSTSTIKSIRAEVKRAKGVESGTIIAFDREKGLTDLRTLEATGETVTLSYAAIYVNGRWFLTGTSGVGAKSYSNREFFDLIAGETISNVRVATAFEEV
jgi:hypothetical protein